MRFTRTPLPVFSGLAISNIPEPAAPEQFVLKVQSYPGSSPAFPSLMVAYIGTALFPYSERSNLSAHRFRRFHIPILALKTRGKSYGTF